MKIWRVLYTYGKFMATQLFHLCFFCDCTMPSAVFLALILLTHHLRHARTSCAKAWNVVQSIQCNSPCFCCSLGAVVQLCDFHKEQAWLRWINNLRNGVDSADKDELLAILRNISHADSPTKYDAAVQFLQRSRVWKANTALQNWFSRRWLPHNKAS